MKKGKIYLGVLMLLILIGTFLRINNLGMLSLWGDEAVFALSAKGILSTGVPNLPSNSVYPRAIPLSYLIGISFKLLGVNEVAARIPSVIFGILIIPLTYLTGRVIIDQKVGIVSSFIITLSPWAIAWSREARMYSMFQFFSLFTFLLFYLGFIKNKKNFKYIAILSFAITLTLHQTGILLIPVFFLVLLYEKKIKTIRSKHILIGLILISLAVIIPIILEKILLKGSTNTLSVLTTNVEKPFFYYKIFFNMFPAFSLLILAPLILILLIGLKNKLWSKEIKEINHLWISFIVPIITLTLMLSWRREVYSFFLLPFFILSSVSLLFFGFKLLNQKFKNLNFKIAMILKIIVIVVVFSLILSSIKLTDAINISKEYYNKNYQPFHSNYKFIYSYLNKNYDEGDIIISTDPVTHYFYSEQETYWLRPTSYEQASIEDDLGRYDIYTKSKLITNEGDIENLLKTNNSHIKRIWFVTDYRFPTRTSVDSFIKENELVLSDEMGKSRLYVLNLSNNQTSFDFGLTNVPAEGGIKITAKTKYTKIKGYGWEEIENIDARERTDEKGSQDFVFSNKENNFKIDIENGRYVVFIKVGDKRTSHGEIDIVVEDKILEGLTKNEKIEERAVHVEVKDNQLNLKITGKKEFWSIDKLRMIKSD